MTGGTPVADDEALTSRIEHVLDTYEARSSYGTPGDENLVRDLAALLHAPGTTTSDDDFLRQTIAAIPVAPDGTRANAPLRDRLPALLALFASDLEDMRANGYELGTQMVRRAYSLARAAAEVLGAAEQQPAATVADPDRDTQTNTADVTGPVHDTAWLHDRVAALHEQYRTYPAPHYPYAKATREAEGLWEQWLRRNVAPFTLSVAQHDVLYVQARKDTDDAGYAQVEARYRELFSLIDRFATAPLD